MIRATLAQMRAHRGRLVSAGLAVLLGSAFMAASLLAIGSLQQSIDDRLTAEFARADLMVTVYEGGLAETFVETVREVPGVAAVDAGNLTPVGVTGPKGEDRVRVAAPASDPRLQLAQVATGRHADKDNEAALDRAVAERLGVEIGDQIDVAWAPEENSHRLTVVGLLSNPPGAVGALLGMEVTGSALDTGLKEAGGGTAQFDQLMLVLGPDANLDEVRAEIVAAAGDTTVSVDARAEFAAQQRAALTGSTATFAVLLLGFATVALVVACVVVANTFQVLVAQRARSLALMRCVGAKRVQVYRAVLLEAGIVGGLSSVLGVAVGMAVVVVAVGAIARAIPDLGFSETVPVSPGALIAPVVVGIVATVLAALVPARHASRVAPVEALHPLEGRPVGRASVSRGVTSFGALVVGGAMMIGGVGLAVATRNSQDEGTEVLLALAIGMMGGIISLVGVLAGSVFVTPAIVRMLGALAGRGSAARLATANATRNPRRTAATANALVIGVALVVMMSAGAASATATLDNELNTTFPVDLTATNNSWDALTKQQIAAITEQPGVVNSAVGHTDVLETAEGQSMEVTAFASPAPVGVYRDPDLLSGLGDNVIIVDPDFVRFADKTVTVFSNDDSDPVEMTFRYAGVGPAAVTTMATLERLSPGVAANTVWVRFADDADVSQEIGELQTTLDTLAEADPNASYVSLGGSAPQRGVYGAVIGTMLAMVLGLLAVAVLIALIGVANTLSLSVIERGRESATLRVIGTTRAQLRRMLAIEGVLVAAVGTVVGCVVGLLYGWAGAAIALSRVGTVTVTVPWLVLAGVAVIAVLAGLIASVLPARGALRRSPVEALGAVG